MEKNSSPQEMEESEEREKVAREEDEYVLLDLDGDLIVHEEEAGPSDVKPAPPKQINPVARLNKVLQFRLYLEAFVDGMDKQLDKPS